MKSIKTIIMRKLFLLVLLSITLSAVYGQNASIREEYIPFTTYSFSDPDPVARPGKIYPYFRFEVFSSVPVVKEHKMVVLENKWIKVWVAPEIGGKVWGALDKKNNKYFIYHNNVVKFRDISMRGAWTSGGIEHNFGSIGHAPTVATPVDYYIQNNPDGSVSCFVGAIELTSRTEWRAEIRLPADKAWFEINSYWNNPTDLKTSLYHWQTAAADATNDLQFYFPGKAHIDHSGNEFSWPVMDDGRDISLYKNNDYNSSHSYHVLGEYGDWFAGYYHNSDYGFGHWTRHPVKPGKKIWIWSLARDGGIWENLLTDPDKGNTQYIEMQTGLLFNQEGDPSTMSPFKHLFFEPGAVEDFTELWFPLSNLRGVKAISREGILNVEKNEKGCLIQFQALSSVKDNLQITDLSGNIIHEYQLDMEPEQIVEKSVDLKSGDVLIKLANGELRYNMSDREANFLDRPLTIQEDFDWESVYGLYTMGVEKAKQRSYDEAEEYFTRCLEKDRWYLPALTSLADIDIRNLKYDNAEKKLLEVIRFNTYDPDANFLYGVILKKKKEYNKARDAFGVTLRSAQYKSASRNQLALIALQENRLEEAREYANDALLFNGMDKNIYRTASVVARLMGDNNTHGQLIQGMLKMDPLNHFAAFEKYYSKKDPEDLKIFKSRITGELDYETYIELALWYMNAGLDDEAFSVMEICPANPVADYLSAYLAEMRNDASKCDFYLQRALKADDKLVFPYREEYVDILAWANKKAPGWKTKYYSALLFWSRQQNEVAGKFFDECGEMPDSYSFYLTRGTFRQRTGSDAEPDFIKALSLEDKNWRPYHTLYNFYFLGNNYADALNITQKAMKVAGDSYIIKFDHAMSLLYNGNYDESVKILEKTEILPHEGAGSGRIAWKMSNLLNALNYYSANKYKKALVYAVNAYKWPENLGVGRPFKVDERAEDFISSMIREKMGDKKGSAELLARVADYNDGKPSRGNSINYLTVIALKKLGRAAESERYFNEWVALGRNEKIIEWAKLMIEGKIAEAADVMKSVSEEGTGTPWNPRATDTEFRLINEIAQRIVLK
jgi:tetratricopeptide (TPR) repeat protein